MGMDRTETLLKALDAAVAKVPADAAISFSGGLDSGILAGLAKRRGRPTLYTVGVEGAADLIAAEEAAAFLELPWTPIIVNQDDILRSARALLSVIPPDDPVAISFELPLHMVASTANGGRPHYRSGSR